MPELEYKSRQFGWVKAEEAAYGQETAQDARDGTKHLLVTLTGGKQVIRRHVAHEAHEASVNVLHGRCRLCVQNVDPKTGEHVSIGRVYRAKGARPEPEPIETETAPSGGLPEISRDLDREDMERVKAVLPRTHRT